MNVSQVTRGYLNKRGDYEDPQRTVTFSIRLTEAQHAKLKFLANRFESHKTPVAQKLLNAAMDESLRTMAAFDTMTYEQTQTIPMDEQLKIVDEQVSKYHDEIRSIFEEDA
jgi:hypothetical protein